MVLNDYSAFIYGHSINKNNRALNFRDSGIVSPLQYTVGVSIGSFTITEFASRISEAMNTVGSQEYTVTLDRDTRKFTISADNNFEILIDSGVNKAISVYTLLGFTGNTDLVGSNSYEADSASGEMYITQTPLFGVSDFQDNKEKAEAQVKTTPSGITEVISYSTLERLKCEMPLITNFIPQRFIRETVTGVEEARAFMDYAIDKKPMEFIYKYNEPNNFVSVILDKTGSNSKGVGFELKSRATRNPPLPGYYELKGLVFLKVEVR